MVEAFELWKASGWVLGLCAILLVLLTTLRKSSRGQQAGRVPWSEWLALGLGLTLLATGAWLRISGLQTFEGGMLTSDENWPIIYVSDVVHRLETYQELGLSHGTFAYTIDLWNRVFGFEPLGARRATVAFGIATIALYFLALRSLTTPSLALLATGLLCASPFAVFFSRLVSEHSYPLFYASACLLAYSCWRRQPGAVQAFPIGLFAGLGYFVYAGFPVALAALVLGCGVACMIGRIGREPDTRARSTGQPLVLVRSVLAAGLGFAAIYVPTILLHTQAFGGRFLTTGGGRLKLSMASMREAWIQLFRDLFIAGSSWYLPFRDLPVLERTLLPFAALGAVWAWRRYRSALARGCLLAAPLLIALCTLSGQYPGMRRALVVLLPYAFCSAAGVLLVLQTLAKPFRVEARSTRVLGRLGSLVGVSLVLLCCFHAVAYQLAFGKQMTGRNFGTGFTGVTTDPIPDDLLIDRLREGHVLLDRGEFGGVMAERYYPSVERLARRYGRLTSTEQRLHYSDDPQVAAEEGWIVLTRDAEVLREQSQRTGLCIPLSEVRNAFGDKILFAVPLVSASRSGEEILCVGSPSHLESIGSRLRFGFTHFKEALRHEMHCAGPYCDPSRPSTVYATGGDISFLLRRPAPQSAGGFSETSPAAAELWLGVVPANVPGRANRLLVNGHPVGTLLAGTLGEGGKARFSIPETATASDPLWRITIESPEPPATGWDLVWAELRPAAPTDPGQR